MVLTWIAWFPALIALYFCIWKSPQRALYSVYIPVLFLLPFIFLAVTPGFPLLTFRQTTIIPITLFTLYWEGARWRWGFMDLLIFLAIFFAVWSEILNEDMHEGINRLANVLCNFGGPYIAGKALIHSKQYSVPFCKRIALLMCVNVILGLYEMRMTAVPQVFITNWFFPGQGSGDWPPLYRFGFVRMSGPFMSPIFFGIAVALAILLQYWLIKTKISRKWYHKLEIAILVFGLIFTFSRGPWVAFILAFLVATAAFTKKIKRSLLYRFLLVVLASMFLFSYFLNYQSGSGSELDATISYRANLWQKYEANIFEKYWLGWGFKNFAKKEGMLSIDNNYLYAWLLNGILGLLLQLCILFWGSVRVVRKALSSLNHAPLTASLSIIFFSIYIFYAIVFLTVVNGIEPLFYLFIGWAEGIAAERFSERNKNLAYEKARLPS